MAVLNYGSYYVQPKASWLKRLLWLVGFGAGWILLVLSGSYLYLDSKLPPVEDMRKVVLKTPLRIYTADGKLIGEFGDQRRLPLTYEQIPPLFIRAILAAEDDRFFAHGGVNLISLGRATTQLLMSQKIRSGGGTITMQVARNYLVGRERSFYRKFREILMALKIEQEFSKEEIMEFYVNHVFLGNRAYGIASAAEVYYGLAIDELNLAQLAMVAAMPKAPSRLNPLVNPERALLRRNWVLGRMLGLGYIHPEIHALAVRAPVSAYYHGTIVEVEASYVAEMVRQEVIERFGPEMYSEGYSIYTTLDSQLQAGAVKALHENLDAYDRRHGFRRPVNRLDLFSAEVLAGIENDDYSLLEEQQPLYEDELEAELEAEEEVANVGPYAAALNFLSTQATYGDKQWALVLKAEPTELAVLMDERRLVRVPWTADLEWARHYINANRRGAVPTSFHGLVAQGDVIALRPGAEPDSWNLDQVPEIQGAVVALDPNDGSVRAMVGGYEFSASKFNRATQAVPSPGSNVKPFIYAAALGRGYTLASIFNDAPVVFEDDRLEQLWRPKNSSGRFYGPTRLREALVKSRNMVSIRLLQTLGIESSVEFMARFGFPVANWPRDLSLALGTGGISPIGMARGYATFANGGYLVDPYLIDRIVDRDHVVRYRHLAPVVCPDCTASIGGEVEQQEPEEIEEQVEEVGEPIGEAGEEVAATSPPQQGLDGAPVPAADAPRPRAPRVLDARIAYLISDMLREAIRRGTGVGAKVLKRPDFAGKTGTTNQATSTWFTGFNTQLVATTWAGFDTPSSLGSWEYGASVALPIWVGLMRSVLDRIPRGIMQPPANMVSVQIDLQTGQRVTSESKAVGFEMFRSEYAPKPLATNGSSSETEEVAPEEIF